MKIGLLCESPVDEAALHVLVAAILQTDVELIKDRPLARRAGGWSGVITVVEPAIRAFHYRPDADGLVVVLDSDDTPIHDATHAQASAADPACRVCQLLASIDRVKTGLASQGGLHLKIAVGLAVPSLEAWLRCGLDPHVGEAQWRLRLNERPAGSSLKHARDELKRHLYGDPPALAQSTQIAKREATRLAASLDLLRQWFPDGFGLLEQTLGDW